ALSRMQPGTPGTMSEGEVDLIEWYLLNHPAPAVGPQDAETRRGRQLLAEMGCESCHVPDWQIQAADARKGLAGDRRFFNLAVTWNDEKSRFEGRVEDLSRVAAGPGGQKLRQPRYGAFKVEGLYSDLRHHDLGERFTERYYYQGKLIPLSRFRTQPLWGVGSTAPYGHDGRSPGLDDVIRRHGGEAESSAEAYRQASEADRSALIAFLRSLVLYQPDVLPTDLDGDGKVAEAWTRSGHEMGPERFFPELLFAHTPVYRGWTDGPDGDRFFSYLLNNQAEAYGETLTALADQNGDGLPDFEQAAPPLPAAGARPSGGRR
nr:di-heme oxidoredictase family protein [Thermoanaerobaculia bacterium]